MPTILDADKQEVSVPIKARRSIEEAIKLRARAKGMEVDAKEMTDTAKATLIPLLNAYGVKSYAMEGIGKVMTKVNKGSAINANKLREALALDGMDAAKINKLIKKVSTTWETDYVDFTPTKGG